MTSPDFSSRSSEFPFGHAADIEPPGVINTRRLSEPTAATWADWLVLRLRETRGTRCLTELRPSPWLPLPKHTPGGMLGRTSRACGLGRGARRWFHLAGHRRVPNLPSLLSNLVVKLFHVTRSPED